MIKRILVGLGGTPFTTVAVKRAVELAKLHNSELTGVTIVDLNRLHHIGPVPAGGMAYAKRMASNRIWVTRECVDEAVAAFEQTCAQAGLDCTVARETGDAFDLMISHSRYHDLTIFGLKSLFDCGMTTEPKDALIRLVSQGVRPILAVSPQYRNIRKALVAYSGSMESAKAMRRFVQMRLWPDVTMEIIHFSPDADKGQALLHAASEYCRAHGYETQTQQLDLDPDTSILSYAQKTGSDIIVMGNSVRSLMSRQILDSTALATVQNADRPLFLAQ